MMVPNSTRAARLRHRTLLYSASLLVLALATPGPAWSQTTPREVVVSLPDAEGSALRGNASLLSAMARQEGAEQHARAASSFLWPQVEASAGVMRTDDPVGVFGTKLRQQRFTERDFELSALNDPAAASDWTAGFGAVWSVGNLSRWAARSASEHSAAAARASRTRAEEATVLRTRLGYLNAVAARGTRSAAEAEVIAAQETAGRVRLRVAEGLATEADRLQAEAALADATARLRMVEASLADALSALAVHLGWEGDSLPVPAEGLPELPDRTTDDAPMAVRADLRASESTVAAARARVRAAGVSRLPAVQVFGQFGTHAPGFLDDPKPNWTVGLELTVPLFTGFGLESSQRAADFEAQAVEAAHDERVRMAESDREAARRGVVAARESRDAARAAEAAAVEASRLLGLRYEEGMATLADLLTAQARAAGMRAGRVEAEVRWLMQLAQLDYVLGEN